MKRGKKKIYHREQMVTMQGATEVIEGYFGWPEKYDQKNIKIKKKK